VLDLDVAGIKRVAGRPATRIEVRSDLPVWQIIDLVTNAHVESGWPNPVMALGGSADVFLVEGPHLTPAGVVFGLDPTSDQDFERTLQAWAGTMEAAGLRGAIGPYLPEHPPFHFARTSTSVLNLVAAMVFRRDDDHVDDFGQMPDDVRGEFLARALEWGQEGGDTIHVSHGLVSGRLNSTAEISDFVSRALSVAPPVSVHWSDSRGFRTVGLDHAGHAWLQVADCRPWFERLADLETFIETHAEHLTYACVSLCSTDHLTWFDALGADIAKSPGVGRKYVSVMSVADETQKVPDAYGSQLIGREHLSATHDLDRWRHTPVADMTWIRASTPASWFADVPDSEVVAAARIDFGDAIQTEEQYVAAWHRSRKRNGNGEGR
jgi:hypothetical protein